MFIPSVVYWPWPHEARVIPSTARPRTLAARANRRPMVILSMWSTPWKTRPPRPRRPGRPARRGNRKTAAGPRGPAPLGELTSPGAVLYGRDRLGRGLGGSAVLVRQRGRDALVVQPAQLGERRLGRDRMGPRRHRRLRERLALGVAPGRPQLPGLGVEDPSVVGVVLGVRGR